MDRGFFKKNVIGAGRVRQASGKHAAMLFYIFHTGQIFKLPVAGQEGDCERLRNRISNAIDQ